MAAWQQCRADFPERDSFLPKMRRDEVQPRREMMLAREGCVQQTVFWHGNPRTEPGGEAVYEVDLATMTARLTTVVEQV
jgi:hypothetical protein